MNQHLRDFLARLAYGIRWNVSGAVLKIPHYGSRLAARALMTEVGLSGHVSVLDDAAAEKLQLSKLNRLERWLMGPRIAEQKRVNWAQFREAVIAVTGEDPDDPYDGYDDPAGDEAFADMFKAQLAAELLSLRASNS